MNLNKYNHGIYFHNELIRDLNIGNIFYKFIQT
jgi:hypothetical protein